MLLLLGLAPIVWLRSGLPIKGVDSFFSLHPQGQFPGVLQAWDARTSTGQPQTDVFAWAVKGVPAVLAKLGTGLAFGQVMVLVVLTSAALLGMRGLARQLLPPSPHVELIAAATAVLWVVNPFALSFVYWHQLHIEMTWAALPWVARTLVRWVRRQMSLRGLAWRLALSGVIASSGFPHPYLPGICVFLFILMLAALGRDDGWSGLGRVGAGLIAFVASLAWWLLPSVPMLSTFLAASEVESSSEQQFQFASHYSQLPEVLTLTTSPQLRQSVGSTPYMDWHALVFGQAGIYLRWVLPCMAAVGVVYAFQRRSRVGCGLAGLVGLGALLEKADNPPFAGLNRALLNLPGGEVFRHPQDKFSFVLVPALVLLFGWGLTALVRSRVGVLLGVLAVVVSCVWLGSPYLTGEVIPSGGPGLASAHVNLPASYDEVGRALAALGSGGKTQVQPYSRNGATGFTWASGIQANTDPIVQDWAPRRSLLARDSHVAGVDVVSQTLDDAVARHDERVFSLAWLAGVDSWMVHRDWRSEVDRPHTPVADAEAFLRGGGASHRTRVVRDTPELLLLRQPALPLVYAATEIYGISPSPTADELLRATARLDMAMSAALVPSNVGAQPIDPGSVAIVHTRGTARVTGEIRSPRGGTALLVFGQTFDPSWRLSLAEGTVLKHLKANGYANAWLVNIPKATTWELAYGPQRSYDVGIVAAAVQLLCGLVGAALSRRTIATAAAPASEVALVGPRTGTGWPG